MPKLGEVIPKMLVERGVDTVFGIPGVHTVEMYRGLPGSGLRHITPRHEQGAGFMADGYARATGQVAACFIITGPGMTNIATAMGQAYGDSIPMLVISSVNHEAHIGRGLGHLHELQDQVSLTAGVAAWSLQVRDVAELAEALDDAMDLFASDRPRPVHIQIPLDRLSDQAGDIPAPRSKKTPPEASTDQITEIARQLNDAQAPLIVCGGGAVNADVRSLAEALGAAVILTSNARGLLPTDHPLLAGGTPYAPAMTELMNSSDVAISLGCEFSDTDWTFYASPPIEFGGELIRVDIDAEHLTKNVTADTLVQADAASVVDSLLPLIDRQPAQPDLAACKTAAEQIMEHRVSRHFPLLRAIWKSAPDAIVIGDSTEPAYAGLVAAHPPAPRQWFTGATGFGTLGYALPAAIGAKLAHPERPVVAVAGDGGALYTLTELAAAVEAEAAITLLIWNNDGYGEIRDYMISNQIKPEGVNLSPVDFEALAKGFGADYLRATTMEEVTSALSPTRPQIIEIRESEWELA
ncbi:MAG: 5-guanidino-2-oxopentanoate decarboxylase [Pikeienuella sp.]